MNCGSSTQATPEENPLLSATVLTDGNFSCAAIAGFETASSGTTCPTANGSGLGRSNWREAAHLDPKEIGVITTAFEKVLSELKLVNPTIH